MNRILPAEEPLSLPDWSRGFGAVPLSNGLVRVAPEDFCVVEKPVCLPDGTGEHLWLRIRKRLRNTQEVAKFLARWAEVKNNQVSFAGLKDRVAITEQWFSIQMPGREAPSTTEPWPEGIELLEMQRHRRKLKRGALTGNDFRITVRQCRGDHAAVERRLTEISRHGVPNYFGEQRFGRQAGNIEKAQAMLMGGKRVRDRNMRSLLISAARSYLFNLVLDYRVSQQNWLRPVADDLIMLDGSHSLFGFDPDDEMLLQRLEEGDVHITGPLPGKGSEDSSSLLERKILEDYSAWVKALAKFQVAADRRALRVIPRSLRFSWVGNDGLQLDFSLPSGSYATAVLREIVDYKNPGQV